MEHEYMGPKLTQAEGFVLGVGAKMFTIAGPVIVYGVSASVVYGLIYWITTLLWIDLLDYNFILECTATILVAVCFFLC